MTPQTPEQIAAEPRELLEAIGELVLAIKPHYMDFNQRKRIQAALHVLVDHIIAVGNARNTGKGKQ